MPIHFPHLRLSTLLIGGCLALGPGWAAAATAPDGKAIGAADLPVQARFTVLIGNQERTMGEFQGGTYLLLTAGDSDNQTLLTGEKDVAFTGKILRLSERGDGRVEVVVHPFSGFAIQSAATLWAERREGDNIHLFGRLSAPSGETPRLVPLVILPAAADADVVSRRFAGIPVGDYLRRLAVAQQLRDEAPKHPNEEFWLSAADHAIDTVITDATAQAEREKSLSRLDQAVVWAVDQLHDPARAAQVATASWARALGGPAYDTIGRRMRALGFEFYRDQWRLRGEALALEYKDRFEAIPWNDADGFYRLGRWTEARAEILPHATELAHRSYATGLKADPNHAGCRNALGQGAEVAIAPGAAPFQNEFTHDNGTVVVGPQGWRRLATPIEGDVSWADPASETAFVSITLNQNGPGTLFKPSWETLIETVSMKSDYSVQADEELPLSLPARSVSYQYRDGDSLRSRETALILEPNKGIMVRLTAGYEDNEREAAHTALRYVAEHLRFPTEPVKPGK